jgi:hypothetical protein
MCQQGGARCVFRSARRTSGGIFGGFYPQTGGYVVPQPPRPEFFGGEPSHLRLRPPAVPVAASRVIETCPTRPFPGQVSRSARVAGARSPARGRSVPEGRLCVVVVQVVACCRAVRCMILKICAAYGSHWVQNGRAEALGSPHQRQSSFCQGLVGVARRGSIRLPLPGEP